MFTESLLHGMGQGYTNSNSFDPPHKHYSYELHLTHGKLFWVARVQRA